LTLSTRISQSFSSIFLSQQIINSSSCRKDQPNRAYDLNRPSAQSVEIKLSNHGFVWITLIEMDTGPPKLPKFWLQRGATSLPTIDPIPTNRHRQAPNFLSCAAARAKLQACASTLTLACLVFVYPDQAWFKLVGEEKQSFWFVSFCETTFTAVE
jgi:hypothetical protein